MVGFTKFPFSPPEIFALRPSTRIFRALLFAFADQRFDARFALRRDHRSHLRAFFEAVADAQLRGRVGNRIAKSFLRFANGDRDGNGKATLPGAAKRAVADDLRGHAHVGVRQAQ